MRIGELARQAGVSADTIRFYERAGWLPRPERQENDYREYTAADVEHVRLLSDLRRLDIPLEEAARVARWCHSGHCSDTSAQLPAMIAERRADVAERIARLRLLDERLAALQSHLIGGRRHMLKVFDAAPCCDAAGAVLAASDVGCSCCAPAGDGAPA